ncbi:hypothetical protein MXD62_06935 [Frankia sp. Mgl5]|nr:hypothetical protein [Frankia sp. Mgl5]MCK9926903.1 hypothetical protein [Frankia sp. Mgl5]
MFEVAHELAGLRIDVRGPAQCRQQREGALRDLRRGHRERAEHLAGRGAVVDGPHGRPLVQGDRFVVARDRLVDGRPEKVDLRGEVGEDGRRGDSGSRGYLGRRGRREAQPDEQLGGRTDRPVRFSRVWAWAWRPAASTTSLSRLVQVVSSFWSARRRN